MTHRFIYPADSETNVKICGLNDELSIDVAVGAGADAIGFVFVPESPRVTERHDANQLMLQLPEDVLAVAVVQNYHSLEDFSDWNGWLQLCGDEDEETVANAPCPVIRAFQWDVEKVHRWDACEHVKAILVDGSKGGHGETFDTTELATLIPSLSKPIIIAGGLTPENVQAIIAQSHPTAVDVSSGVEGTRGIKDPEKICEFIHRVKDVT